MSLEKNDVYFLHWICDETGRKIPAGVAFYNAPQGDYRLKIDVLPDDKVIYLKALGMQDDIVSFKVEATVRKQGHVIHRGEIGYGQSSDGGKYPILIELGPFTKKLSLDVKAA